MEIINTLPYDGECRSSRGGCSFLKERTKELLRDMKKGKPLKAFPFSYLLKVFRFPFSKGNCPAGMRRNHCRKAVHCYILYPPIKISSIWTKLPLQVVIKSRSFCFCILGLSDSLLISVKRFLRRPYVTFLPVSPLN